MAGSSFHSCRSASSGCWEANWLLVNWSPAGSGIPGGTKLLLVLTKGPLVPSSLPALRPVLSPKLTEHLLWAAVWVLLNGEKLKLVKVVLKKKAMGKFSIRMYFTLRFRRAHKNFTNFLKEKSSLIAFRFHINFNTIAFPAAPLFYIFGKRPVWVVGNCGRHGCFERVA